MNAQPRQPLAHASEEERASYVTWLFRLARKTRGRMADHLRHCAELAQQSGFYAGFQP